jgi:hypothetical protein
MRAVHCSQEWHMFGSAVDLKPDGNTLAKRKDSILEWLRIAKYLVDARFVEFQSTQPCVVAGWKCAHADWQRKSLGAIGPDLPLGQNPPAAPAVLQSKSEPLETLHALAESSNWKVRSQAFDSLGLDLQAGTDASESVKVPAASRREIDPVRRRLLTELLSREIGDPWKLSDDDRGDYFLALASAAGLYGGSEAIPLLLDPSVIGTGNVAYEAAARIGDALVPMLVKRSMDQVAPEYGDLVSVGCLMLKVNAAQLPENIKQLGRLVISATRAADEVVRALGARCMRYLPEAVRSPRLLALTRDSSKLVRWHAFEALHGTKG